MKLMHIKILVLSAIAIFCSCSRSYDGFVPVAMVDGTPIYLEQIDREYESAIYNHNIVVYELRDMALNSYIGYLLLREESQKIGGTEMDVLSAFALRRGDTCIDNSEQLFRYKQELIDSLKREHDIKISLLEPLAPALDLDSVFQIMVSSAPSPVTLTLVADISCESCRKAYPIFKDISKLYAGRINCRYIDFAPVSDIYSKALTISEWNDKGAVLLDSLMTTACPPDSTKVINILSGLGLDVSCIAEEETNKNLTEMIDINHYRISASGMGQTPTILVNNRPLRNPYYKEGICSMIERAIYDCSRQQNK
ncbi:MAG: hypothetical protein MJZ31_03430 [Bacteroidales bacterium]|nr:hypothetical protein [Bacteroidales bacterium]